MKKIKELYGTIYKYFGTKTMTVEKIKMVSITRELPMGFYCEKSIRPFTKKPMYHIVCDTCNSDVTYYRDKENEAITEFYKRGHSEETCKMFLRDDHRDNIGEMKIENAKFIDNGVDTYDTSLVPVPSMFK